MRPWVVAPIALLVAAAGPFHAGADPATNKIDRESGCAKNPAVVGPCFAVRGRAVVGNGTPSFKIIQAGTARVFGVLSAENEIVPPCLAKAVTLTSEVTGEFRVCPFTLAKKEQMQMVCVDSVGEFTTRRWNEETRAYVAGAPAPGCAVTASVFDRGWRDGIPADVVDLVERYDGCNHWGGEEGYSEERRKEIADGVRRLGCDHLEADQRKLRKKYARKPRVVRVIIAASKYESE